MKCNVFSFAAAKHRDLDTSLYVFKEHEVPIGRINATLDFKIWAKKVLAINCYFSGADTKFILTVYCDRFGYRLAPGGIDFSTCPTGMIYTVDIQFINGKVKFIGAIQGI